VREKRGVECRVKIISTCLKIIARHKVKTTHQAPKKVSCALGSRRNTGKKKREGILRK
jgi:hypothetical protein